MTVSDVGLYVDDGAEFQTLLRALMKELDPSAARVRPLFAEDIIDNKALFGNLVAFVMPGGADLPYCDRLNGLGNSRLRGYVEDGGHYLGFCAGAYYACRALEFHKGRPDEVSGPRELALLDAVAIGSISELGPLYDLTKRGASAVQLAWKGIGRFRTYYNGGPRFDLDETSTAEVIATYVEAADAPAVVRQRVGDGFAILSGVHVENTGQSVDLELSQLTDGDSYRHLAVQLSDHETSRRIAFRSLLELSGIALRRTE